MSVLSGYSEAIALSTRTIDVRAARYKHLVISVVVVCAVSASLAIAIRAWWPLLGLLLLFPLCALFYHRDAAVVRCWRIAIVDSWAGGHLELLTLRSALESLAALPGGTLQGMLRTLPVIAADEAPCRMSLDTRRALALTLHRFDLCESDRRAAGTIARLWVGGLVAWAVVAQSWWPLLGIVVLPGVLGAPTLIAERRARAWRNHLAVLEAGGLDVQQFVTVARRVDWHGVPAVWRDQLLDSLS